MKRSRGRRLLFVSGSIAVVMICSPAFGWAAPPDPPAPAPAPVVSVPEPVTAPAPAVSLPEPAAAPAPVAPAPAASATPPQAQTPLSTPHEENPAEPPKGGNAPVPPTAQPHEPASSTAATPVPAAKAPVSTAPTAAADEPSTSTNPSAAPAKTTPAPASGGNEPGRQEAAKPGQRPTGDSELYARHRWPYHWNWNRDLAWDDTYAYDWANSGYWDNWQPTWTDTCPYRCPTNDNAPYPPDVQDYLDAHPDLAEEFARVHQFPWELRRAQIQPFLDSHPDYQAWFNNRQPWI
ncbi:hypothetical protein MYCSP_08615 [Mycobacteroides saopaulense]|uniref:hemophore-related protein n=1 Tax=Mycobacteroides saopaulense TaxID=1578165 RepID=UPI000721C327|nr:hemophore-related protein [Mycobacteroides saopaulense]ALR11515.1 hypothetical protein MYCSP_08615 [Mycobacteroides saopaulense]